MDHVESVRETGDRRLHWKAKGPAGLTIEWDTEIVDDQPNTLIAWRALTESPVKPSGVIRFQPGPGGRGTLVTVELDYAPSGGTALKRIAKLFGKGAGVILEHNLRALKQIMEVGEIVKSDSSIHTGMHPAQPPATL
jgi:uncharacterized membrane protein